MVICNTTNIFPEVSEREEFWLMCYAYPTLLRYLQTEKAIVWGWTEYRSTTLLWHTLNVCEINFQLFTSML